MNETVARRPRILTPVARSSQLLARWGRAERGDAPSIVYAWGAAGACKADSRILMAALEEAPVYEGLSLVSELKARGYDLTTIKFSIDHRSWR
jgi:hypothetical protein